MKFAPRPCVIVLVGCLASCLGCRYEVPQPANAQPSAPVVIPTENQTPGPVDAAATADRETGQVPTPVVTPPPAPKLSLAPLLKSERIYIRNTAGAKQFQFKPKEADSVKYYDTNGTELCKLTMHPDKLKVKSANDQPLFELKWHGDKVSFKDGTTDKELSKLRFKGADFEYVVGEATKAKIVHQEDGSYHIQDPEGKEIGQVYSKDGHALWVGSDGMSLKCEETGNPLAILGLGLPDLTAPQQAALFVYFVSRPEK